MHMYTLQNFYTSKEWVLFRQSVMADRLNDTDELICEHCGEPIVRAYDCIAHHKIALTDANVNDVMISLNPENIMLVHHVCHNKIHNKLGYLYKQVYLVYGSPLSGKTTYVNGVKEPGDLIIDMDNIWQCVSGLDRYKRDGRLNAVVFGIRDTLLDMVKYKTGKWNNAYIVGGYPLISERERLCRTLGAREVFIDTSMSECLLRLESSSDGRNVAEWTGYIEDWWRKFGPPGTIKK